jgi:cytochrome c-type biogenesis protein CcmH
MASSPLFWVLALALVAATLALLVLPLLRRSAAREAPADESAATAVFRDHKRQIDADYAARTISEAERDAALAELTRRFGQELAHATPAAAQVGERSRWVAALVLVACVPVVAGVLYFTLGNPAAMTADVRAPTVTDAQIDRMVDELAKRLQKNPDDGEGWAMLGRSYRVLGRLDASVLAYSEAAKRLPSNAGVLVDWAEAAAQLQGRSLAGQPTELLERALKLEPNNVKALALLGAASMERNDRATAKALWTRLRAALPPDSPQLAQVDAALARVNESPVSPARATASTSIEGRVEIDPKLAKSLAPTDTVFIFARDPDGPRMPLAAMKIAGADLPRTFALTDDMAMSPALTISKAGKIVVEARVSKSGDVKAQPGDLAGTSAPVAPGARDVRVTIDRVLP